VPDPALTTNAMREVLALVLEAVLVGWFLLLAPARGVAQLEAVAKALDARPGDDGPQLALAARFVVRWSLVAAVCAGVLWLDGAGLSGPPLFARAPDPVFAVLAVAAMACFLALSVVLAWRAPEPIREGIAKLGYVRTMFPRSGRAALALAAMSVAAGVGEELVFRRLVPVFFAHLTGSALVAPLVLSSVAFGLAHRYQGARGMAVTGLIGVLMYGLVVGSGSLWTAVIAHALVDLRFASLYLVLGPLGRYEAR
jgi:membrane protease YdiL (CAAX protease family)